MNKKPEYLDAIHSFGAVAAEEEPVLDYFLTTDLVERVEARQTLLVLGRKGSGKTALVKYFAAGANKTSVSSALSFKNYPWTIHSKLIDYGASPSEVYISSWSLLLAIELAKMAYSLSTDKRHSSAKNISKFLKTNYGTESPDTADLLRPTKLSLEGTLEPQLFGSKLGSLSLRPAASLGKEIQVICDALLAATGRLASDQLKSDTLLLHLDELDQGLDEFTSDRESMLTGLILAARNIRNRFVDARLGLSPIVYLRTDLWDSLRFSDKNKITEASSVHIKWSGEQLQDLIELRASSMVGKTIGWDDLEDGELMRGSQRKWNHIIARTYLRPRDCIKFCNEALGRVRDRSSGGRVFTNPDISDARDGYSDYLKRELDDEITPHWSDWADGLEVLSANSTLTFAKQDFESYFNTHFPGNSRNAQEALAALFRFGVVGYRRSSGYGGSSWIFKHESPDARWDPGAIAYKVHPGLKEFCRLKEDRG